jgi:hypothetical protein
LNKINQEGATVAKALKIMHDGLTKGSEGRLDTSSPRYGVAASLDSIILKLAALSQPLSIRPDYGTTGDLAERLKKVKEKLKEASMYKVIPMQDYDDAIPPVPEQMPPEESECIEDYDEGPQAPGPKVIVLEDQEPEVAKEGPPCCSQCGQPIPACFSHDAGVVGSKIKKIRDMLKNTKLTEAQLRAIHQALDEIDKRFQRLEKDKRGDD